MEKVITFEKEEYDKLIELLGLTDNPAVEEDTTNYFDAWNFGKSEDDYNFVAHSSLS